MAKSRKITTTDAEHLHQFGITSELRIILHKQKLLNSQNINTVKSTHLFTCEFCQKVSSSRNNDERHQKICKLNPNQTDPKWVQSQKQFQCKFCEFSAVQKCQVIIHERRHTGFKPFKCMYCSYASTTHGDLNVHIRKHTKEKPHKCLKCDYSGASNTSLKRHIERKHNKANSTKYFCQLCTRKFVSKGELFGHISMHTKEKPYACVLCNYASSYMTNLKRHLISHKTEKNYKCQFCSKCFGCNLYRCRHEKICKRKKQ